MTVEAMDWFGATVRPLDGGYSGETFLVGDDSADQVVLRVYRRNPDRAMIDASLLRLVRGILPVPEVIEARPARGDEPALMVTEKLDGTPLDVLLRTDPPGLDWEELGLEVGLMLSRLSGIPFLAPGFFDDPQLTVSSEGMPDDLREFAQHYRDHGRLAAWQHHDYDALLDLVDQAEDVSADAALEMAGRTVLVHSDFNPKNILVDPVRSEVVGLVDWEFSHAGNPYADFGNLSRFEREDRFAGAALEAFVDHSPGIRHAVERGRAADLWALVELAGGVPTNAVRELATELLLAQARSGHLQAWPWAIDRVDPADGNPVP